MKLTKKEFDAIQIECNHYEHDRAAVIEALKIIQKSKGWVSDDAILLVAQTLHIAVSDVEGIATFYNQIFRQPVGQHIVRYCDSIVCFMIGCEKIRESLECALGIKIGNTTKDNKFTLLPTCCLGRCDQASIIMIDADIYSRVVPENINQLLSLYQ